MATKRAFLADLLKVSHTLENLEFPETQAPPDILLLSLSLNQQVCVGARWLAGCGKG